MSECSFCRIVRGLDPASRVYTDPAVIAFMDIQPVNPGHVLVIPTTHADYLAALPPETGAHMFQVAMRVATALRQSGIRCEGINLFLADGTAAFQEVFHVHLHVIPRFQSDGFGLTFSPEYGRRPGRTALDEAAARIRGALERM